MLQVFCSEDLGAFYLDILKDRLYTTAPGSHARRSAQTALWHIAHAMLRWMAPFLSFTAEEAWQVFGPKGSPSIFVETYVDVRPWHDEALLARWRGIAEVRAESNRHIEALRAEGAARLVAAGRGDRQGRAETPRRRWPRSATTCASS